MGSHVRDMVEYRLNQLRALDVINDKEYNKVLPLMGEYEEPWYAGTLLYKQNPYTAIDAFILKKAGKIK